MLFVVLNLQLNVNDVVVCDVSNVVARENKTLETLLEEQWQKRDHW